MFFLMLHLISHGGKFDLFFNSSFTRLNKRSGIFVSFLCILKGLNSLHECIYKQAETFKEQTRKGDLLEGAGLFIYLSF